MTMLLILGAAVLIALLCSMNATQNDSGRMTFTAGAALEAFRIVKLDGTTANQVVYTGAGEAGIGVTQDTAASGDPVTVKLFTAPGTFKVTAAGAIAQNALVYPAANGKVDDAAQGSPIGRLNDVTATADGDQVEMIARQSEGDSSGALSIAVSVAAAGSTNADAGVLLAGWDVYPVSAADDTKGVIIAAADAVTGKRITIVNNVSNKILKIYGPPGAVINGAAANAGYSTKSGGGAQLVCLSGSGNTWGAIG